MGSLDRNRHRYNLDSDDIDHNREYKEKEMRIIDEKGRIFSRYNFFDVLVVLLLVLVFGGMIGQGIRLNSKRVSQQTEEQIRIEVKAEYDKNYGDKMRELEIYKEAFKEGMKARR